MIASGVWLLTAEAQEGQVTRTFAVYQGDLLQLPVRFEYPADWQVESSSGSTEIYSQVQIYGPPSLEDRLRTYLVVRAIPPKVHGGRYENLDEMVEGYRKDLLPTLHIEQEQQTIVLGQPARLLDVIGTLRLPWKSPTSELVPVKSQRIFLDKNGWFYELAWMATPEVALTVEEAFSHLLQTFSLSE
jgi:hypothetical protein